MRLWLSSFLLAAVVCSLAVSGCGATANVAPRSTPVDVHVDALPAASVTLVREIPNAGICSAVASGPLVVESFASGEEGGLRVYSTWDSDDSSRLAVGLVAGTGSPYTAAGPANPSASASGVYFDADARLYFQGYGDDQARDLGIKNVSRVWASPSGECLLVEQAGTSGRGYAYSFVDRVTSLPEIDWSPRDGSVGDAVWLSDSQLIVQVDDSPPNGGWGTVYSLQLAGASVREAIAASVPMSCPAPNPSGDIWAHVYDGGLAFSKQGHPERMLLWRAAEWGLDAWCSGELVWLDAKHIAIAVTDSRSHTTGLWIVECTEALRRVEADS